VSTVKGPYDDSEYSIENDGIKRENYNRAINIGCGTEMTFEGFVPIGHKCR